ncbi:hypothetical protein [Pyrococcus abyssi]|uniref:Uncharacterized protein n=1 Tax=Pyrococcus abyssi (strain GE5 / Orsay) TaxID=272844 RepID=Q9UZQ9_PYRAB|nr:hypothetical protein [Pyrococcus abyssi]CAB49997.1 Hypothetical protein PAB1649 [Pyrococcus abyssi GE5]CCE70499.1 TPA: hypothetical protein PAB1649 [Pyrococcus abyssi GE5]
MSFKDKGKNLSSVFGVRNLPSCLEAKDIGMEVLDNSKAVISVALKIKEPGECSMNDAYLDILLENSSNRVPLGNVTFEILTPGDRRLKIPSYVEASIGLEAVIPKMMYTIFQPVQ